MRSSQRGVQRPLVRELSVPEEKVAESIDENEQRKRKHNQEETSNNTSKQKGAIVNNRRETKKKKTNLQHTPMISPGEDTPASLSSLSSSSSSSSKRQKKEGLPEIVGTKSKCGNKPSASTVNTAKGTTGEKTTTAAASTSDPPNTPLSSSISTLNQFAFVPARKKKPARSGIVQQNQEEEQAQEQEKEQGKQDEKEEEGHNNGFDDGRGSDDFDDLLNLMDEDEE
eukprot:m.89731 g.89731  ORF g.89731 m.89731 type:complete len:226 (+) comp12297_c0_seq3:728-1405(+)